MVWTGAKQGHSYAEVEMQGGEKFNETALFFHLAQISSGISLPKTGDLFFEIFRVGFFPLSLDRIFVVMVPMNQRQRWSQLRYPRVGPRFRYTAWIPPHNNQSASVLNFGGIINSFNESYGHVTVRMLNLGRLL